MRTEQQIILATEALDNMGRRLRAWARKPDADADAIMERTKELNYLQALVDVANKAATLEQVKDQLVIDAYQSGYQQGRKVGISSRGNLPSKPTPWEKEQLRAWSIAHAKDKYNF